MESLFPGRWISLRSGTGFLLLGLCILSLLMISVWIWVWAFGAFHHAASGVHRRLSDFIHAVVVHRRDEAIRMAGLVREDPMVHPIGGFVQIWFSQLHFFSVSFILRLMVLGCLRIQQGLMKNSERSGFPTLGKGIPALRNSIERLMSGYLFCLMFIYPG